jgi:formylglycine-generating enzyme required for sulfatase activity
MPFMKKLLSFICALSILGAFAAPRVSNVKATKKSWGYEITYRVSDATEADAKTQRLEVSVKVGGERKAAQSLIGDVECENGVRRVSWMAQQDGVPLAQAGRAVSVRFREIVFRYCVIDLSGGAKAKAYPVSYLEKEPKGGFNTPEYKTKKLVLKRVEAGSFVMGEKQMDDSHRVTLTKPFYMGLFEVTQKQWELVTGENPSSRKGETRPVDRVSYDMIRGNKKGAEWPASGDVDKSSSLGKLRMKSGIAFDLPTEAQREYACRAGTTTKYSYGNKADGDYMWYNDNSGQTSHEVGMKKPNPWGFYDMHGNVYEWCLDWSGLLAYGADPKGVAAGTERVHRGGAWSWGADGASAIRRSDPSSFVESDRGLRLCAPAQ